MSWLRLEAAYFSHPKMIRAGWDAKVVFLACMTMVKLHGWRHGVIPKCDLAPEVVRAHLGCPERSHSDTALQAAVDRLVQVGLLVDDGEAYKIAGWSKYQPDPTGAERQRKSRAKKKPKKPVTVTTVSHGNGTGRDGTGQDEESPPPRRGVQIEQAQAERSTVLTWASIRSDRPGPFQKTAQDLLRWSKERSLSDDRVNREYDRLEEVDPDGFRRAHQRLARAAKRAAS